MSAKFDMPAGPPTTSVCSAVQHDIRTGAPSEYFPLIKAAMADGVTSASAASELLLEGRRLTCAGKHWPENCSDALGTGARLALAVQWAGLLPNVYHHMMGMLYSIWHEAVRPRVAAARRNGSQTSGVLYLPAGDHICADGKNAFVELWSLFSGCAGLRIEREPWAPFCYRGCCGSRGKPPEGLAKELTVISGFAAEHTAMEASKRVHGQFRSDVHYCFGGADAQQQRRQQPATRRALWMLAGSGSNGRRIKNESVIIEVVRAALARDARHSWDLHVLDTHTISYGDEVRWLIRSDLVFGLFGSGLSNCRFMRSGSTIVQLHGALKNDFGERPEWMYKRLCNESLGVRWVGYATRSFRPVVTNPERAARAAAGTPDKDSSGRYIQYWANEVIDGTNTFEVAHVDAPQFAIFLDKLLGGEWDALSAQWDEQMRKFPDPRPDLRVIRKYREEKTRRENASTSG